MKEFPIPLIYLSGDAFTRGQRFGREASNSIAQNIDTYWGLFKNRVGMEPEDVLANALEFAGPIEAYSPSLLEEMRGIAYGAGRRFEEILALNVRSELMFAAGMKPEGCTSLGLGPKATANGHVIVAQNWDWNPATRHTCVLLVIEPTDGQAVVTFTEAGLVGKIGFNASGVGLCLNALSTDRPAPHGLGAPVHVLCRTVLDQARNATDAVSILGQAQRGGPANYLVGSKDGAVVDAETAPWSFGCIHPHRGMVTHANHYELADFQAEDVGKSRFPDSMMRSFRIAELLEPYLGSLNVDTVKTALSDNQGWPRSICRHLDERQAPYERFVTIASLIMDLTGMTLYFCDGAPCESRYNAFSMEELLAHGRSTA